MRNLIAWWTKVVRSVRGSTCSRIQRLQGGERLRSDLTIWTGGGVAPPLLHAAKLAPKPRQWAPVDATLRSRRHHNVFVIGDAAALPTPVQKQAFHALEMGEWAAAKTAAHAIGWTNSYVRERRTWLGRGWRTQ